MAFERPYSPKSVKAAQLADLVRDLLAGYIHKEFPTPIVTVTSVSLSPDFNRATAWVRVFPVGESKATEARLQKMTGMLQHHLKRDIARKFVPDIQIRLDTNLEDETHIAELLK